MAYELVPCPPPDKATIDPVAERLGLAAGLYAEEKSEQYRCYECGRMQPRGSVLVWVPEGTARSDPAWAVTENARRNTGNGHWSGWCVGCAPKESANANGRLHFLLPMFRRYTSILALAGSAAAFGAAYYIAGDPNQDTALQACIILAGVLFFVGMVAWSEDW